MAVTTAAAIRDRARRVVELLAPASHGGLAFRPFAGENEADFRAECERNVEGSARLFFIRDTGADRPAVVSDAVAVEELVTLELWVAYPQTQRFGPDAALDRDDVMEQDRNALKDALGMHGRANFSSVVDASYPDATPRPRLSRVVRVRGRGVDFDVFTLAYSYFRAVT